MHIITNIQKKNERKKEYISKRILNSITQTHDNEYE